MTFYTSKTFCKCHRITVLAAWADLCAAANRIPSCICPFDCGVLCHRIKRVFVDPCCTSKPHPRAHKLFRALRKGPNDKGAGSFHLIELLSFCTKGFSDILSSAFGLHIPVQGIWERHPFHLSLAPA